MTSCPACSTSKPLGSINILHTLKAVKSLVILYRIINGCSEWCRDGCLNSPGLPFRPDATTGMSVTDVNPLAYRVNGGWPGVVGSPVGYPGCRPWFWGAVWRGPAVPGAGAARRAGGRSGVAALLSGGARVRGSPGLVLLRLRRSQLRDRFLRGIEQAQGPVKTRHLEEERHVRLAPGSATEPPAACVRLAQHQELTDAARIHVLHVAQFDDDTVGLAPVDPLTQLNDQRRDVRPRAFDACGRRTRIRRSRSIWYACWFMSRPSL